MINKVITADEAVAGVKDGMTIMVGGFLGTGSPEILMDALPDIGDQSGLRFQGIHRDQPDKTNAFFEFVDICHQASSSPGILFTTLIT